VSIENVPIDDLVEGDETPDSGERIKTAPGGVITYHREEHAPGFNGGGLILQLGVDIAAGAGTGVLANWLYTRLQELGVSTVTIGNERVEADLEAIDQALSDVRNESRDVRTAEVLAAHRKAAPDSIPELYYHALGHHHEGQSRTALELFLATWEQHGQVDPGTDPFRDALCAGVCAAAQLSILDTSRETEPSDLLSTVEEHHDQLTQPVHRLFAALTDNEPAISVEELTQQAEQDSETDRDQLEIRVCLQFLDQLATRSYE
jgi:hypothetical protein